MDRRSGGGTSSATTTTPGLGTYIKKLRMEGHATQPRYPDHTKAFEGGTKQRFR